MPVATRAGGAASAAVENVSNTAAANHFSMIIP
jgi:hypothetical protein